MLDCSCYEWIIESTNEIAFPLMNSLVRQQRERLAWFHFKLNIRKRTVLEQKRLTLFGPPIVVARTPCPLVIQSTSI